MRKYQVAVLCVDRVRDSANSDARRTDRQRVNYLEQSIDSLMLTAGLRLLPENQWAVTLFDSGSSRLDYLAPVVARWPGVAVDPAAQRLPLFDNFTRALRSAAGKARYVCLMEDDVVFRPLAFVAMDRWLDRLEGRDFGCVTLWSLPADPVDSELVAKPGVYWGNYFVIFRSDRLLQMLDHPLCRTWPNPVTPDLMIGAWARETGQDILVNSDSLIQHVGVYSALGDRDERVSDTFDPAFPSIAPCDLGPGLVRPDGESGKPWFPTLFPGARPGIGAGYSLVCYEDRYFIERAGVRRYELSPSSALVLGLCDTSMTFGSIVEQISACYTEQLTLQEAGEEVSSILLRYLDLKVVELFGLPGKP